MPERVPTSVNLTPQILAAGMGWEAMAIVCRSGPRDRPFEEQHRAVSIAAVTAGTFQYRSSVGTAALIPGSVLLGGLGVCFECGHEHGIGDRCISFKFRPETWEEIVAAVPGARSVALGRPHLPPMAALAPLLAEIEATRDNDDSGAFEDLALRFAGAVIATVADAPKHSSAPSSRDVRRVTAAVRRIAAAPAEPASLAALSRDCAMSPFHFLRTFRQVVGLSPHQYVLRTRLHQAALRLKRGGDSVSEIAYDAGFNDLSSFNHRFKKVMGVNPSRYRTGRR